MSVVTKAYLKTKFLRGLRPAQQDYVDLIDSYQQIISTAGAGAFGAQILETTTTAQAQDLLNAVTVSGTQTAFDKTLIRPVLTSAQSNALNFGNENIVLFREGTFTPTVIGSGTAGTASYSAQTGRYMRINNRVFITLNLIWSGGTGTGNLQITGLPFTVGYTAGFTGYADGIAAGAGNVLQPYVAASSTNIIFVVLPQTTGIAASLAYDGAGDFRASFSYEI